MITISISVILSSSFGINAENLIILVTQLYLGPACEKDREGRVIIIDR